jgi:hypothetical protein
MDISWSCEYNSNKKKKEKDLQPTALPQRMLIMHFKNDLITMLVHVKGKRKRNKLQGNEIRVL